MARKKRYSYEPEPKYLKATVFGLDSWGNAQDGWEVNDRWKIDTWYVSEEFLNSKRDIMLFLKSADLLKKTVQLRQLYIDNSGDADIFVDHAASGQPLFQIEIGE